MFLTKVGECRKISCRKTCGGISEEISRIQVRNRKTLV